ncbi:hypothetical protein B0J18DRAFT_421690 [Chaetomium sp. MPI-SDFR-AT-0129]|nr:hypothetical protein B0J18DRAFT_421690 [Chaetomium sp. MPI-SDFR-AT-0129]
MAPGPRKKTCAAFGRITPAKRKAGDDSDENTPIAKTKRRKGDYYGVRSITPPLKLTRRNLALLDYLNGDDGKKKKDSTDFGSTSTAMDKTKPAYNNDPRYDANVSPVIRPISPDQDSIQSWPNTRLALAVPQSFEVPVPPSHLGSHRHYNHKRYLTLCHFAAGFRRMNGDFNQAVCRRGYDNAALVHTRNWVLSQAGADALGGTYRRSC